jgi:pimeloyl-ACP methyl ester carboxylesterase
MKLSQSKWAACLLPLLAIVQPATAITNSRSLPLESTNSGLLSTPNRRSIAQNQKQCPKGQFAVTVGAPNNNSPSFSGKLESGVDPMTRCIFFKDISINTSSSSKPKQTWLIIHGWLNNSNSNDIKGLANIVAQQKKGDRVLMLDWGEAAINKGENGSGDDGQKSIGVYYAASWIRPIAEAAVEQLRNKYGITIQEAPIKLNIIGHSLGTLMAAEIGDVYMGLTKYELPIKSIIALDPPSELSTNGSLTYDLGGYDVDGRTPAYTYKGKTIVWSHRDLHPEAIDRPKRFDRVARFSRAFVGKKSLAGNQEFAGWAHESFQMDFGSITDTGDEHGRVVLTFANMISQHPFKQPKSKLDFLDLNDLISHSDCKQEGFIKCNAYNKNHEGRIEVDANNRPTMVKFYQSGISNEVSIAADTKAISAITSSPKPDLQSAVPTANASPNSQQPTCNAIISQVKSQLSLQGYGEEVSIKKDNLHTGVPKKRPYNLTFTVLPSDDSGSRQLQFSRDIIGKCPQISSVSFYISGTDFTGTHGLINGQIKQFPCYYFTASNDKIPWGYNPAHMRCYKGKCPKGLPCNP